jgi:ribonuclease P/MRP protein subunit RPP40
VVQIPRLQPLEEQTDEAGEYFNDFAIDIYEWLSLISLNSPRVDANDRIDPFLSRYSPPSPDVPDTQIESLVKVSWEGFFPGSWAYQALVQVLLAAPSKFWFSYAVSGFNDSISKGSRDCTILKTSGPSREFLLWEVEQN